MTNDEILSRTISYLRFPLSVAIVFIHYSIAGGIRIDGITYGADNPEWFIFIVNFISQALARIGVPLFFLISGFLFFYRSDFNKDVYKRKLRSRAKTLLIPFILWNTIAVLWQLKCFLPGFSSFFDPVEIRFSLVRLFHTYFCYTYHSGIILGPPYFSDDLYYPIDGPLWFVRDLMVMVVISPIIYWIIKRTRIWPVIFLGIIWLFSSLFIGWWDYLFQLVTAAFFFSWGAYYSILKKNFVISFRYLKYAPIIYIPIAIFDALTKEQVYNEYIHNIGILLGIVSVVVIVSYLIEYEKVKVNKTLANSSFFIYALHYMFIRDLGKLIFVFCVLPDDSPYAMLTLYIVVPILSTLICLGLYVLLKAYLPRICNLLTGGR